MWQITSKFTCAEEAAFCLFVETRQNKNTDPTETFTSGQKTSLWTGQQQYTHQASSHIRPQQPQDDTSTSNQEEPTEPAAMTPTAPLPTTKTPQIERQWRQRQLPLQRSGRRPYRPWQSEKPQRHLKHVRYAHEKTWAPTQRFLGRGQSWRHLQPLAGSSISQETRNASLEKVHRKDAWNTGLEYQQWTVQSKQQFSTGNQLNSPFLWFASKDYQALVGKISHEDRTKAIPAKPQGETRTSALMRQRARSADTARITDKDKQWSLRQKRHPREDSQNKGQHGEGWSNFTMDMCKVPAYHPNSSLTDNRNNHITLTSPNASSTPNETSDGARSTIMNYHHYQQHHTKIPPSNLYRIAHKHPGKLQLQCSPIWRAKPKHNASTQRTKTAINYGNPWCTNASSSNNKASLDNSEIEIVDQCILE